jgi:hypothetical protein
MTELALVAATPMEMRAVLEGAGLDAAPPGPGEEKRARIRGRAARLVVCGVGPDRKSVV